MKLSVKVSGLLLGKVLVGAGAFLCNYFNENKAIKIEEKVEKTPKKRGYIGCIEANKPVKVCNWLYPKKYRNLNYEEFQN